MRKLIALLLLTVVVATVTIVYCFRKPSAPQLPISYVSLRRTATEGVHTLRWIVENRSPRDSQILTFPEGSILNYEIQNTHTGWFYRNSINEYRGLDILRRGEVFEYVVDLNRLNLTKGHYVVHFWAVSTEGTRPKMIIQFDLP